MDESDDSDRRQNNMNSCFSNGSIAVWANSFQCGTCVYWGGCKRIQGRRIEYDIFEDSCCNNPLSPDYGNKVKGKHHCDSHKMTFLGKIRGIDRVKMQPAFTNGYAKTLNDFWNDFPQLNINSGKKWHKFLMQYIECPEAVFAIRDKSRRGTYMDYQNGCRIVYADNIQAKLYYTMYMDDYVPENINEVINAYRAYQVPASEGKSSNEKISFPTKSNIKCFKGNYLAHIVAVAEDAYLNPDNHRSLSQKEIIERYCVSPQVVNWEETKKYLVAMFLRYVHPFNYFVVPGQDYQVPNINIPLDKNNIGEHRPMVEYVKKKYLDLYGDEYRQFLRLVMSTNENVQGDTIIDLHYGSLIHEKKGV